MDTSFLIYINTVILRKLSSLLCFGGCVYWMQNGRCTTLWRSVFSLCYRMATIPFVKLCVCVIQFLFIYWCVVYQFYNWKWSVRINMCGYKFISHYILSRINDSVVISLLNRIYIVQFIQVCVLEVTIRGYLQVILLII